MCSNVLLRRCKRRRPSSRKYPVILTQFKGTKRNVTRLYEDCHDSVDCSECDLETCHCGCGRQITQFLSVLLQRFFTSKRKWLRSLRVSKGRPKELDQVIQVIQEKGYDDFATKGLDLDVIDLDVSRQQWLMEEENANMVKQALIAFCVVNNVGYWQGLHDVAAALVYLSPRPTTGELAAILEMLVLNFASILLRVTEDNVVNDAGKISARWRLMFQFFFPKAATDIEKLSEFNSWNVNWFLTMGFYRFGCAYVVLSYVYAVILCSAGCMTAFMYQELGYLGVRGYMRWLMNKNVESNGIVGNLLDGHLDESFLSKVLTNSRMVHIEAEEMINVSRNLYDTLNGVDCELATFPLISILRFSNFFFNKSPLSLYKNSDIQVKTVVEIKISDIFKGNETQRFTEGQCKQSQVRTKDMKEWHNPCLHSLRPSERLNNELLNIYLKNLHDNVLKKSFIYPSRFAGGISQNGSFYCNIVDVRSNYLTYGEPLDSFFGDTAVSYVTQDDIDSILSEGSFSPVFTIWIIITDSGYDNPQDPLSLQSLDKGVDMYTMLTRIYSGVALLRGGYTALLKWRNLPIPSKFNVPFIKKFLGWIPVARDTVPRISIENVVDTFGDPFTDITARYRTSVSARQNIFLNNSSAVALSDQDLPRTFRPCKRHTVYINIGRVMSAVFNSDGGVNVNGMVWNPRVVARRKSAPWSSFALYMSTLFQVANIDGIMEVVPINTGLPGLRNIVKRRMSDFHDFMTRDVVVICDDNSTSIYCPSRRLFRAVTRLYPTCRYAIRKPVVKRWLMCIISTKMLTAAIIKDECIVITYVSLSSKEANVDIRDSMQDPGQKDYNACADDFISAHPFKIPLEQMIGAMDGSITSGQVTMHESFVTSRGSSAMSSDVRMQPLCSERRAHVFSRRIKTHTKPVENVNKAALVQGKQQNAVHMKKNVFVPRNQLKRSQTREGIQ